MEHHNSLKEGLEADEVMAGCMVETASPILIEILGQLGYDWVWIDTEHKNKSPYDAPWLENLTRAAECAGVELVIRLPSGSYPPLIRKVLDAGIRNIVLPRVKTADEVQRAIEAARFTHDGNPGERGIGFGRSSAYGDSFDLAGSETSYAKLEDDNILVGVMIENQEAFSNLDKILSVPEIGFIIPGPGDMSTSVDHPLEYDHPDVTEAVKEVRSACNDREIHHLSLAGAHFEDAEGAQAEIENGVRLIGLGQDLGAFREVQSERLDWLPE